MPNFIPVTKLSHKYQDLTGKRFGFLRVVKLAGRYANGPGLIWECLCDCGITSFVFASALKSGSTISCGHFRMQRLLAGITTHGDTNAPIYNVWCGIKERCNCTSSSSYHNYGARGIKLLWPDYESFKRDMLAGYAPGLTIERMDKNGHYCKDNCRWATKTEQARNRRNNRLISFNGITKCLSAWAESTGICASAIRTRLQMGWSPERSLTTPVKSYKRQ